MASSLLGIYDIFSNKRKVDDIYTCNTLISWTSSLGKSMLQTTRPWAAYFLLSLASISLLCTFHHVLLLISTRCLLTCQLILCSLQHVLLSLSTQMLTFCSSINNQNAYQEPVAYLTGTNWHPSIMPVDSVYLEEKIWTKWKLYAKLSNVSAILFTL